MNITPRITLRRLLTVAAVIATGITTGASPASAASTPAVLTGPVQGGGAITLAVNRSSRELVGVRLRADFACQDGDVDEATVTMPMTEDPVDIVAGRFRARLVLDADDFIRGGRVLIGGWAVGSRAVGVLSGVEYSRDHGLCRTGVTRWSASQH